MVPSEIFSMKELGPKIAGSVTTGISVLPSVFVAKSPCGDCEGGGIAGKRAGAVLAAGAVGAAVEDASSAMAAGGNSVMESSETMVLKW